MGQGNQSKVFIDERSMSESNSAKNNESIAEQTYYEEETSERLFASVPRRRQSRRYEPRTDEGHDEQLDDVDEGVEEAQTIDLWPTLGRRRQGALRSERKE